MRGVYGHRDKQLVADDETRHRGGVPAMPAHPRVRQSTLVKRHRTRL